MAAVMLSHQAIGDDGGLYTHTITIRFPEDISFTAVISKSLGLAMVRGNARKCS